MSVCRDGSFGSAGSAGLSSAAIMPSAELRRDEEMTEMAGGWQKAVVAAQQKAASTIVRISIAAAGTRRERDCGARFHLLGLPQKATRRARLVWTQSARTI